MLTESDVASHVASLNRNELLIGLVKMPYVISFATHRGDQRANSWWPVNSPLKGQWRGALKFSLICVWINDWVNNREAGDLRRYRLHHDVIVMSPVNAYPSKTDWHKLISITRQPQLQADQSGGSLMLDDIHLGNIREHYIANLPILEGREENNLKTKRCVWIWHWQFIHRRKA